MTSYSVFAKYYDLLSSDIDYMSVSDYHFALFLKYGNKGNKALDLACGTGSLTTLYAKKGLKVIGIDKSEEMLTAAENKAFNNGQNIQFSAQDMTDFSLPGKTDVIFSSFDSISHLPCTKALDLTFSRAANTLNDGGLFIFDINTPYKNSVILGNNTFVYDIDELYMVWQNSFSPSTKKVKLSLDFFVKQGDFYKKYSESFYESTFSVKQIKKYLNANDFEIIEMFDDFTHNKPHPASQRITFICTCK